jgi:hypothetical protein
VRDARRRFRWRIDGLGEPDRARSSMIHGGSASLRSTVRKRARISGM